MNKLSYNLKTIYDYIDGNDLDFDVDKLEDDVNFMMKVIILTNDKNMYNLCSNNVKSDFSFTKFMINKFNQDYKFIETVADNYLELNKKIDTLEEGNKIEIQALMHNILSKKENDYYSIYSLSLSSAYNVERISINSYLQDADDSIKEILGLGFIIISENYYNKENTLNYFAERMLEEIVYEQDESFENYVHKVFSNPKLIEKYGRNKFLLSYISTHDNCLANYVSCNMELIK